MNRRTLFLTIAALGIMSACAVILTHAQGRQQLGLPGLKTRAIPDSIRLQVELPKQVLDYQSEELPVEDLVLKALPIDTSFGMRRYTAPDKFTFDLRAVLMGQDRTSLHKPQFCLTGQGWHINDVASSNVVLHVDRPYGYDLPVVKLVLSTFDKEKRPVSGVYVYWFIAEDAVSGSALGAQRMWWMAKKLLTTGVLQRWAYVSCFAACAPGQETATFERMSRFIVDAVPEFQLYPRANANTSVAKK